MTINESFSLLNIFPEVVYNFAKLLKQQNEEIRPFFYGKLISRSLKHFPPYCCATHHQLLTVFNDQ